MTGRTRRRNLRRVRGALCRILDRNGRPAKIVADPEVLRLAVTDRDAAPTSTFPGPFGEPSAPTADAA